MLLNSRDAPLDRREAQGALESVEALGLLAGRPVAETAREDDATGEAVGGVAASRLLDDARLNIATKFPSRCFLGVATLGGEEAVSLGFLGVTRVGSGSAISLFLLGAATLGIGSGIWLAARNTAHAPASASQSLSLAILLGPKHYKDIPS